MDDRIMLKPRGTARCIHPATGFELPADGARVKPDFYWRRMIARGDAEQVPEPRQDEGIGYAEPKTRKAKSKTEE